LTASSLSTVGLAVESFVEDVERDLICCSELSLLLYPQHLAALTLCSVCHDVLERALSSGCDNQHVYCQACFAEWAVQQGAGDLSCPECRKAIHDADFTPMPVLDRMVGRLQ